MKDFPGTWAEYRVFDGGVLQVHRRISTPEALDWTEQTRHMFAGTYADYAFGDARRPLLRHAALHAARDRSPALAGIRVLDLATVIAGPGAARYLADYGADVLKVERPGQRRQHPRHGVPDPADGTSLYWKLVSRGKRCATVDLKTDEGRDTILRLVEDAHVVDRELPAGHPGAARPRTRRAPRAQPRPRDPPRHRLRAGRALRGAPWLRHHRRGHVGLRVDQRRARRRPAAAAHRPHRRGHRPGGRVRHDGRAVVGRGVRWST